MNRAAVKIRLIEIGTYALTDVELYEDRTETIPVLLVPWDAEAATSLGLYLGQTTGNIEPSTVGSRPVTEDRWDIECHMVVPGCPDDTTAELAAEAAFNAFDGVLRRLQRLVDPLDEIPTADPPVSASELAPWDVAWLHASAGEGPYRPPPRKGSTTQMGVVQFTITALTSYQ